MAENKTAEQIVHFSYDLAGAIDDLRSFRHLSPKGSSKDGIRGVFANKVSRHVQEIEHLADRAMAVSIFFGAGYLELIKPSRVAPPSLWGSVSELPELSYPSFHLSAYRWLRALSRQLSDLLGYRLGFDVTSARPVVADLDRNELLDRWFAARQDAVEWAHQAATIPPDGYGLLAMERLQSVLTCEALDKLLPSVEKAEWTYRKKETAETDRLVSAGITDNNALAELVPGSADAIRQRKSRALRRMNGKKPSSRRKS